MFPIKGAFTFSFSGTHMYLTWNSYSIYKDETRFFFNIPVFFAYLKALRAGAQIYLNTSPQYLLETQYPEVPIHVR